MPDLVEVAREPANQEVDVLLVDYDLQLAGAEPQPTLERVRRFVERRGWGLEVAVLGADDIDAFSDRFDLPGPIPVTLAFDAQGREVAREEGGADPERFRELFAAARGR